MSETKALPRPRQVTVAGTMAVVGCVLLVVALFDAMAAVRTPETRSMVEDFLGRPPGDGLGIGVEQGLAIVHGIVLFNGAVAAAATVLAVYTLLRHNGARIGLTVAAAVLLFTAPFSGGVLPIVVAAAATMLWSEPARDWFAGRQPRPAAQPGSADRPAWPARPGHPDRPSGHDEVPGSQPAAGWAPPRPEQRLDRPTPGAGDPARPAPSAYPFGSAPPERGPLATLPTDGRLPVAGTRPTAVTVAAWLTWVFAGLVLTVYGAALLMLVTMRDQLIDALRSYPEVASMQASDRELVAALWLAGVVVVAWSLSAMVLAFLAYRRVGWARAMLVVSSVAAGLASLAPFPLGLVHAVAAFTTAGLLLSRPVSAWFASRRLGYDGPAGPSAQEPREPHQAHEGRQEPDRHDEHDEQRGKHRDERPPGNVW